MLLVILQTVSLSNLTEPCCVWFQNQTELLVFEPNQIFNKLVYN